MSKFRKNVATEIPVTLSTGFTHWDNESNEQVRGQLEYIGFYSQALFRMIKAAIESLGDFDDKEIEWKRYDIIHTCDIGVSVASAISPLLEIFDDETMPETELNEIEKPVETVEAVKVAEPLPTRQTAEISSLALQLSAILNNQNLPVEIYNSVMEAVGTIYNKGDNQMLNDFESSPEYLKALLLAYAKREVSH